jgi:ribosomal protein S18 acetylase RimI-like enzyme
VRYALHVDDYTLGLARVTEAPQLAAMSRRFIEHGLAPSWPAARIISHIRHAESLVLAARRDHQVIGFAVMQFGEDRAHLNLLAVALEHRRRGIARRLLSWLEESAVTAGTFVISLELRAINTEAFAFYSALGYHEVRRIDGYYQGVEQAIRMSRDLSLVTANRS